MITSLRKTLAYNETLEDPREPPRTCFAYDDVYRINCNLTNTREKYVKGGKRNKKQVPKMKRIHHVVDTGQDKRFDILRKMSEKRHREKIEMMEVLRN